MDTSVITLWSILQVLFHVFLVVNFVSMVVSFILRKTNSDYTYMLMINVILAVVYMVCGFAFVWR